MASTYSRALPQSRLASRLPSRQLFRPAGQDARDGGGDFPAHEFKAPARRFVVEQDAAGGVHAVGFAVVAGKLKARDLADAVARARVEAGALVLRHFIHQAEHFARSGEVKAALGRQRLQRREDEMGAVDISVEGRELVIERICHEALRGQVVAFVRLHGRNHAEGAGIALGRGGVQDQLIADAGDPREPVFGVFQRHPADGSVYCVAFGNKQLRQIGAVLPGNAGDESARSHRQGYRSMGSRSGRLVTLLGMLGRVGRR